MTIEKKLLGTNPSGGGAANVADVFSTYLYEGNGSTGQTITNGIDLAGEGGMVWMKSRTSGQNHGLVDTEKGNASLLCSNLTDSEKPYTDISAFNSDGFDLGYYSGWFNGAATSYASWTFRKAPKFFDVVTYTGSGSAKTISHNLESAPAMIMVKRIDSASGWYVFHKNTSQPHNKYLFLNTTAAESNYDNLWGPNAYLPTDTEFKVGEPNNVSGGTYVAYLFADNSAEDADDQMIKCGSYTGNSNTNGVEVNLGWEPQWLLIKASSKSEYWVLMDTMRGISTGSLDSFLSPNVADSEFNYDDYAEITPTGFKLKTTDARLNSSSHSYIYMAIRAPMMKEPESATEVFAVDGRGVTDSKYFWKSGFPVDLALSLRKSGDTKTTYTRLTSSSLSTDSTSVESAFTDDRLASSDGYYYASGGWEADTDRHGVMFKRAKGFFDVVAYSGNYTAGHEIKHSLGVPPEIIITKTRKTSKSWCVYHKYVTEYKFLNLDTNAQPVLNINRWNNTAPTDSVFTVGRSHQTNTSGPLIAFLFATLAGISKVDVFQLGNANTDVDCGFSNGARFILIKRIDSEGDWKMYDTVRGITAGADPELTLNNTAAEKTQGNYIHPYPAGFTVLGDRWPSGTYIYLAIA